MPRPVSFTSTFLHTPLVKESAESSQATSRDEMPVYYFPARYGRMEAFVQSADFGKFKEEYKAVLSSIGTFVEKHGHLLVPPNLAGTEEDKKRVQQMCVDKVKNHLGTLATHLFEGNRFNAPGREDHRPEMYGTCKQWFHDLDKLLQDDGIRLEKRVMAVVDLAPRLEMCSGGITADLQETIGGLKGAKEGLNGMAHKWKKKMLDALILEHVKANHAYPVGEEIHYVKAYYNALAPRMGMEKTRDSYADRLVQTNEDTGITAITPEQLEACENQVRQKLKLNPTRLAADLAEDYRNRIEESLREENLDPNNIDFSEGYQKVKTTLKALTSEYGPMPEYDVLDMNDAATALSYIGSQQPTRGTRHFLRKLKDAGLVDYGQQQKNENGEKVGEKSTIVLGKTSEGRVKMLDDLLWLKEDLDVKTDSRIREFPAASLLQLDPGELLGRIELAGANAQERTQLLSNIVGRIHESLETASDATELLGPWLNGVVTNMREMAARPRREESRRWEPGWSGPFVLLAAAFDQEAALRELLKAGGDKNTKDGNGRTALMLAAQKGNRQAMQALIDRRADVQLKDRNGNTALMFAAQGGHVDIVNALIKAWANKNAANKDGWTALMFAARYNHVDVARFLIRERANLRAVATNDAYLTALRLAEMQGHVEMVHVLMEATEKDNDTCRVM